MLKKNPKGRENHLKYGVHFPYSLCFLSLPCGLGTAVGQIDSFAIRGFGKAERTHSQGRAVEDKTGKMLQKLLPWQLQKEPLRQREPRLQKGPVAAALPTVL